MGLEHVNQLIVYEKVPTMQNQMLEMMDCISVDPTHENDYRSVLDATTSVIALRALHFIDRHGLWQRFVDEDTAGER